MSEFLRWSIIDSSIPNDQVLTAKEVNADENAALLVAKCTMTDSTLTVEGVWAMPPSALFTNTKQSLSLRSSFKYSTPVLKAGKGASVAVVIDPELMHPALATYIGTTGPASSPAAAAPTTPGVKSSGRLQARRESVSLSSAPIVPDSTIYNPASFGSGRDKMPAEIIPISGNYTGGFSMSTEGVAGDIQEKKFPEQNVQLCFKQRDSVFIVDGIGKNCFGWFTLRGEMNPLTMTFWASKKYCPEGPPPACPIPDAYWALIKPAPSAGVKRNPVIKKEVESSGAMSTPALASSKRAPKSKSLDADMLPFDSPNNGLGNGGGNNLFHDAPALDTASFFFERLSGLIEKIIATEYGSYFSSPVDPVALGIPDYFNIVKYPMDFGTILKKIATGVYQSTEEANQDCLLIFSNCFLYNPRGTAVFTAGKVVEREFKAGLNNIQKAVNELVRKSQKKGGTPGNFTTPGLQRTGMNPSPPPSVTDSQGKTTSMSKGGNAGSKGGTKGGGGSGTAKGSSKKEKAKPREPNELKPMNKVTSAHELASVRANLLNMRKSLSMIDVMVEYPGVHGTTTATTTTTSSGGGGNGPVSDTDTLQRRISALPLPKRQIVVQIIMESPHHLDYEIDPNNIVVSELNESAVKNVHVYLECVFSRKRKYSHISNLRSSLPNSRSASPIVDNNTFIQPTSRSYSPLENQRSASPVPFTSHPVTTNYTLGGVSLRHRR